MKTKEEILTKRMLADGISKNTILFFILFLKEFDSVAEVETTTYKISRIYNVNVNTLRTYMRNLIRKNYLVDRRIKRKSRIGDYDVVVKHRYSLSAKTLNILKEYINQQLNRHTVMQLE